MMSDRAGLDIGLEIFLLRRARPKQYTPLRNLTLDDDEQRRERL